jgi:Zn-finger nucleic acid-binding protein
MKCPVDNADLTISDRQGVEIDFCPQCRGVWLDRGELDKIVDRSSNFESDAAAATATTAAGTMTTTTKVASVASSGDCSTSVRA